MKKYLILSIAIISSTKFFAQTAPVYATLAVGTNVVASGTNSFATGTNVQSLGLGSFGAGRDVKAGEYSIAFGNQVTSSQGGIAIGTSSGAIGQCVTIGSNLTAQGYLSVAMGTNISTMGKRSSFAIGDENFLANNFGNDADNQMLMRFKNGYKFHLTNQTLAFAINPNGTVGIDQSNSNNGTINGGLIFGGASGEGIASRRTGGANQYGLDFYTNFANRMSITNGGNLGLGTLTPTAKFSLGTNGEELLGTAPSKIFKTYSGVLGTNAGAEIKLASFGFKSGNWSSLGITAYRFNGADGWQNAAILFGYDVDNTPGAGSYFALAGNGNFGIGTAAPGAKLHVMGNIIATGTITPSDIRYKKNIHPLKGALKKVMALSGYSYSLRTNEFPNMQFDSKQQVGLIAQEVENVLPQVVYTTQDGYKGVDYAKIVPLLIEGMKDQQQIIEKQQSQIDELRKMLVALSGK